ncbi:MAG: hypothetical protein ACXVCS_09655 [Bdellovibrionota bacterium]
MRKIALFLFLGLLYAYAVTALGRTSEVFFDSRQYFDYARNLVETGVYGLEAGKPDMSREPAYGFYLAALFSTVRAVGLSPSIAALLEPARIFWVKALQALVLFLCAGLCAFRGEIPDRARKPLFFLLILSPTVIGANRELFSEALAIPLATLLLFFLSRVLAGRSKWNLLGVFFSQAALVFTKSYLYYLSFPALLWTVRRRINPVFFAALALGLGGLTAQKIWDARNHARFGENTDNTRLSIALAGKVARIDRVHWHTDWPVAIAGALGTNFCDSRYGEQRCKLFDYRGCDEIGNAINYGLRIKLGAQFLADQAVKHDMAQLFLQRPITQVSGSGLELLRMFFFESVLDSGTLPGFLQTPARAWHIVGSLLLWALIGLSFRDIFRHRRNYTLALACGAILVYHAGTMSQITNVVRYVFPVLPFLYFFAADGIGLLLEKRWKISKT